MIKKYVVSIIRVQEVELLALKVYTVSEIVGKCKPNVL